MKRQDIDSFWSRVKEGTRVTCLANTYNPNMPGVSGIVDKPGKTSIRVRMADGQPRWMSPPRNVRDVLSIEGDTITYNIDQRPGHTATWRIEP